MSEAVYFDTSALAKWYINESRSEDVEAENGDANPFRRGVYNMESAT